MFPARFFPNRQFTPRYFAKGGPGGGGSLPPDGPGLETWARDDRLWAKASDDRLHARAADDRLWTRAETD